ncbi:hypothetical protein A3K63_03425 [Candidatus Micrarchaeota archaeon RBG_16_49_10]|nr:MAG: hypothetical protein A3K63_03425 [Candidatus Micrarchaeota archaeon RBG_16_49_10]
MNMRRVAALVERDFKIMMSLKWKLVETFFFPITSILIWGFFILWSREMAFQAGLILLAVNMFWGFSSRIQSGIDQQLMEDRWTETFRQISVSPMRPFEYLAGKIVIGLFFAIVSFAIVFLITTMFFDFTFFTQHSGYFILITLLTIVASIALSILVAAAITVLGNEYGFISWTAMQGIMLFSAPFFPLTIYPPILQALASIFPYTWIFESIRALSFTGVAPTAMLVKALLLSVAYLIASIPLYNKAYEKARMNGRLVKIW